MRSRNEQPDERALTELYDLIAGRRWLGSGLSTYPDGDEDARALHGMCVVLEARGLIRRTTRDGWVFWEPA